jgi:reductive dehalogenase
MFKRATWDPNFGGLDRKLWGERPSVQKEGLTLEDRALENAGWYVKWQFGKVGFDKGVRMHTAGLLSWESQSEASYRPLPRGTKLTVTDPATMSQYIKKAAKFLGASMVGICELDKRWLYSHSYHMMNHAHEVVEMPEEAKYAIVIAIEMDYQMIKTSPSCIEGAATGLGYSMMAFVAGSLAHFIRDLGYMALPSANDTALSIPIAIDAGLGELGRNGLLITPEFGPRVRLSKVFTDLPLVPDDPREFGVLEFCDKCHKCARNCPSQAILYGGRTDKARNVSNNSGVLKWPIDAEKCLSYWERAGTDCANCIRVCPFSKPKGALHSAARWMVKNTPWLDSLLLRMDDAFGYGKQARAKEYWGNVS